MDGKIGLKSLKNINLAPSKNTLKKTGTALVLLLSTIALSSCSGSLDFEHFGDGIPYLIWNMLCVPSLCIAVPTLILISLSNYGERKKQEREEPNGSYVDYYPYHDRP